VPSYNLKRMAYKQAMACLYIKKFKGGIKNEKNS